MTSPPTSTPGTDPRLPPPPPSHGTSDAGGTPWYPSGPVPWDAVPSRTGPSLATRAVYLLIVLLTASAVIVTYLWLTDVLPRPVLLDEASLEEGVLRTLQGELPDATISSLDCPPEVQVRPGSQLACSFEAYGEKFLVPVEVLDDEGRYRVGLPLDEE